MPRHERTPLSVCVVAHPRWAAQFPAIRGSGFVAGYANYKATCVPEPVESLCIRRCHGHAPFWTENFCTAAVRWAPFAHPSSAARVVLVAAIWHAGRCPSAHPTAPYRQSFERRVGTSYGQACNRFALVPTQGSPLVYGSPEITDPMDGKRCTHEVTFFRG